MVKIKKGIVWPHIMAIALILVGVLLIAIIFLPWIFEKYPEVTQPFEPFLRALGFGGEPGYYIIDFDVTKGLGRNVIIQWLVLDDERVTGDYLFHNSSGEDRQKIPEVNRVLRGGVYELEYELPNFETRTVGIVVSYEDDDGEGEETQEVVVDFKSGFDLASLRAFETLSETVIRSHLLGSSQTNINRRYNNYPLYQDLLLVGFNRGNVVEICGTVIGNIGKNTLFMPQECEGTSCLCLCKKESDPCHGGKRVCFGFDDVDYFISEHRELHAGDKIAGLRDPTSGGDAYYLALYGQCGNPLIPGNTWGSRNIEIEKRTVNNRIFIKINQI